MKEVYKERLQIQWKNFSLEQVNTKEGPDWRIWDQPDSYPARGFPALRAAEAARRQGPEAYDRMHFALLEGRHERRKDFTDPKDILEIAGAAGLDLPRFKRDLPDPALKKIIGDDHMHALNTYGVFGTPTLLFENGEIFFVRIKAPQTAEEGAEIFEHVHSLFVQRHMVNEVKRPRRPRPE